MSKDRGWIFVDVLVALGLVAVALGFIAPAVTGLGGLQRGQESRMFAAMEAGQDDPWAKFR